MNHRKRIFRESHLHYEKISFLFYFKTDSRLLKSEKNKIFYVTKPGTQMEEQVYLEETTSDLWMALWKREQKVKSKQTHQNKLL
jgi:hypothetical protein